MLMYLVNYPQPDIDNAIRELPKSMDWSTPTGTKELKRVIKYVLDTTQYGLKMVPVRTSELCTLLAYTYNKWSGDRETRISVSGYIL